MTGATHILTAATIYKYGKFKAPALYSLAFLSHFLLDAVPHYELSMAWNYVLAVAAAIFLFQTARQTRDYQILIAGFLGALPDINWMLQISPQLSQIHYLLHFKPLYPVPVLFFMMEVVFALMCIYLLLKKCKELAIIE